MDMERKGSWGATFLAVSSPVGHFLLLIVGFMAVLSIRGGRVLSSLSDGGPFVWLVVGGAALGFLALLGLGIWLTRRPDAPSWPLGIIPTAVVLLGAIGVFFGMQKVDAAMEAADPSQKAMLLAGGLAESLTVDALSTVLGTVLFSSASAVAAARAFAQVGKKQFGGAAIAALLVGFGTLVLAVAARFLWEPLGWGIPLAWLPAFTGCVGIVICSTSLSAPKQVGQSNAVGDLLLTALLALGGIGTAAVNIRLSGLINGFEAVAATSPDGRLELMGRAWTDASTAMLAHLVHGVPIVLAMLIGIIARPDMLGRGIIRVFGGLAAAVVGGAITFGIPFLHIDSFGKAMARMWTQPATGLSGNKDIEIVRVEGKTRLDSVMPPILFVGRTNVRLDKTPLGSASLLDNEAGCAALAKKASPEGSTLPVVALDASTPFSRMQCLAAALTNTSSIGNVLRRSVSEIHWVVQPETSGGASLPPPFDSVEKGPGALRTTIDRATKSGRGVALHLSEGAWETRQAADKEPRRIEGTFKDRLKALRGEIGAGRMVRVSAEPGVLARMILPALALAGPAYPPTIVVGPREAAKPEAPDAGAMDSSPDAAEDTEPKVTGNLAPEIIKRVVSKAKPKLTACYEKALAKKPDLAGTVRVRFVIDPKGKVSEASDAESKLDDPKVVECVVGVFKKLKFPKPDDGEVLVVYPVAFSTDS